MSRSTRLDPAPTQPNYLLLRTLAAQLRREIGRHLPSSGCAVLDLGCGDRPYEPLFAGRTDRYVGVDARARPRVDVVARAEDLPFTDGEFDCVLCSQVIEHVIDPRAVIAEIRRVLRPGGLALVSTHGLVRYHPNPEDYWRWTHAGLEQLARDLGHWPRVEVFANGGSGAALVYLGASEVREFAARVGGLRAFGGVTAVLNAVAWRFDRSELRRRNGRPPSLAANYLLSATR